MQYASRPILLLLLLLPASAALALGQRGRAVRPGAAHHSRQTQKQPSSFTYGNVKLSGYDAISGQLGIVAEARGAGTTVDWADPQTKAKGRLQARRITVTWAKGSSQAQRIEAAGDVRYSGTRPTEDGEQEARGTGSDAVFVRAESLLTLRGPVGFHAEQPSPDGKSRQSVTGTSESATFNTEKQVLVFSGHVDATVTIPESLEAPARINGADRITLELAQRPYKFDLSGGTVGFSPKSAPPAPEKQK